MGEMNGSSSGPDRSRNPSIFRNFDRGGRPHTQGRPTRPTDAASWSPSATRTAAGPSRGGTRDRESGKSSLLPPSSSSKSVVASATRRERVLAAKKEALESVYKEHDGLVRELFHLTKVRGSLAGASMPDMLC